MPGDALAFYIETKIPVPVSLPADFVAVLT